jgi:hypothetical protein
MKSQTQDPLASLVGKAMWGCGRAADMTTFQFGSRVRRKNLFGEATEVGEYALHVQCAWRIRRVDRIVVGSGDLYYPEGFTDKSKEIPVDFDWDRHPNRRDMLLKSLFDDGEHTAKNIELGEAGALRIEFGQSLYLEVFPDNSLSNEFWRLLSPGKDEYHLVMTGGGRATP